MAAVKYWVWLSALRGLSSRAACAVIDAFGGPMEAYFAPFDSYAALPDVTEKDASLLRQKDLSEAERILGECEEKNIRILTIRDADYPLRLQQIYDPPQVLYLRGKLPYLDEAPTIALVGTRKASPYGEKMAASLGYQIARGGGVVVTGMALGNDAAAARGALLGQGKCVGVLGSAIDVDYPRQNASLIADVAAVGCILRGYELSPPQPHHQRTEQRRVRGGSSGAERRAHHRQRRPRAGARFVRGARQRGQPQLRGQQRAAAGGGQGRHERGGHSRGVQRDVLRQSG